jgi:hypothetical protein
VNQEGRGGREGEGERERHSSSWRRQRKGTNHRPHLSPPSSSSCSLIIIIIILRRLTGRDDEGPILSDDRPVPPQHAHTRLPPRLLISSHHHPLRLLLLLLLLQYYRSSLPLPFPFLSPIFSLKEVIVRFRVVEIDHLQIAQTAFFKLGLAKLRWCHLAGRWDLGWQSRRRWWDVLLIVAVVVVGGIVLRLGGVEEGFGSELMFV